MNIGNFKPNTAPVSFSGTVFKDLNLDAVKQANEPGLKGLEVLHRSE